MQKRDIYSNENRWENWKKEYFNKTPKGVKKADWKFLTQFLKDMELGINTSKEKKGKREAGTLLNLSSHNKFFLKHFTKPLIKLKKRDLHNLEKKIDDGKILKSNGKKFIAFGNYIKDFKVFWNWLLRTKNVKENIAEDISSKTEKPNWVFLSEEDIKKFFNSLLLDYRVYCWFLYDSGMRVTEAMNVRILDFENDFSKVTISDDTAKTFGRTINLKICTELVKTFVKDNDLKGEDFLIQKQPFAINKYLRYHCSKIFGKDKISHPKSKGVYDEFTIYDIRHNSSCYWLNRYPTHKGLMYRMGWRKADKIEYYSGFLGIRDELTDDNMVLGEDKNKIYKLENEIEKVKQQRKEDFIKFQDLFISKFDSLEKEGDEKKMIAYAKSMTPMIQDLPKK